MAFRVQRLADTFEQQPVGLIVNALATLVLDRFALDLEFLLCHGVQQEAHAVGFEPQHFLELIVGHSLEIVRSIGVGRPVECPAGLGNDLEVLLVGDVFRALEHHVLEEMRESRLADFLARRSHVIRDIDVHERVRVVLVQYHGQAVVQRVLLVRYDDPVSGRRIHALYECQRWRQRSRITARRPARGFACSEDDTEQCVDHE